MTKLNFQILFLLLLPFINWGQSNADIAASKAYFDHCQFKIIKTDTIVHHYTLGTINTPDYKTIDSTEIWADIILLDAPQYLDPIQLKQKVESIQNNNHIHKAFVFRDEQASFLFRMSSDYAYQQLKASDGYLGTFHWK